MTGSSSTSPTPTSRRRPTSSCSSRTRSRTWSSASSAGSALFGARFRENAARSLLIPRAYPGKRTPLWQQRLKSQSLLEVAKDFPRFPVILETYRECLRDVLDLPALVEILARPSLAPDHAGRGRDPDALRRSPRRCSSTTSPPTCTRATLRTPNAAPPLWRSTATCSRELLGAEELRELIDPEALEEVERSLGLMHPDALAKDRDALQQVLRRLGDLTTEEVRAAGRRGLLGRVDARQARARATRREGSDRRRGALDRRRGRGPLPRRARRSAAGGTSGLVPRRGRRRDARPRPPLRAHPRAVPDGPDQRRATASTSRPALKELERSGELVRGELLPGGTEREWCDADVLRRLRRASVARAPPRGRGGRPRRARSLPAGVAERRRPPPGRRRARPPARGAGPASGRRADAGGLGARRAAAPPRRLQPDLARRADDGRRGCLDRRRAARPGPAGSRSTSARTSASPGPPPSNAKLDRPEGEVHDAIRERLAAGAVFWLDLVAELEFDAEELNAALWDLAWAGEVTNDAFAPLRARRLTAVRPAAPPGAPLRRAARRGRAGGPGALVAHRAAVSRRPARRPPAARPGRADARALRDRHPRDRARRGRAGRVLQPSTASSRTSRCSAPPGAATSSRASAAPSSRSPAPSSGCAACRAPRATTCCWRRPIPPSPTARRCRGRSRAEGRPARRAPPAPSSCCATAARSSTSSAAARGILRLGELEGEELAEAVAEVADAARRGADPEARDRAHRRRAGDRLGPRGDADRGRLQPPAAAAGRVGLRPRDARGRHDPPRRPADERGASRGARSSVAEAPNPRSPVHHRRAPSCRRRPLECAEARGKHLLAHFSGGLVVHSHLGHERPLVGRGDGELRVRSSRGCCSAPAGRSPRRSGGQILRLVSESRARNDPGLMQLGPDPLRDRASTAARPPTGCVEMGAGREVGDALLDQRIIAGDRQRDPHRGLFQARVSPGGR